MHSFILVQDGEKGVKCFCNKSCHFLRKRCILQLCPSHGCLPTPTAHALFSPPIRKAHKYSTQPQWLVNQGSFGVSFGSNEKGTYRKILSIMTSFEMAACGKWASCQRSRLMFDLTLTEGFGAAIAVVAKAARVMQQDFPLNPGSHYAPKTNLSVLKISG